MVKTKNDLTGEKFGRWTVIKQTDDYIKPNGTKHARWLCKCECGNIKKVKQENLLKGSSKSCGCLIGDTSSKSRKKYNTYDLSGKYGIGYLSNGKRFYFDLDDYDKIKNYCWNTVTGYLKTDLYNKKTKKKSSILMHRLILGVTNDDLYVDHINHNKLDNRKCNLRLTTNQQNCINRKVSKNCKSKITGVYFDKKTRKWCASIKYNYNNIFLGRYNKLIDAIKARREAEEKYFGEYSLSNSIKLSRKIHHAG